MKESLDEARVVDVVAQDRKKLVERGHGCEEKSEWDEERRET